MVFHLLIRFLSYLGLMLHQLMSVTFFRAVMGLYLALAMFWVIGAFNAKYRLAALYSLVIFMLGLATGRMLSLLVDGMPHWLLVVYLLLELGFGILGLKMIRIEDQNEEK